MTETLSLTADPREDGLVKSKTGDATTAAIYDAWYESVYVPTIEETPTANTTSTKTAAKTTTVKEG